MYIRLHKFISVFKENDKTKNIRIKQTIKRLIKKNKLKCVSDMCFTAQQNSKAIAPKIKKKNKIKNKTRNVQIP